MIKSAHIQNFQSHKDTFIEFGDNVNIFIGFSDSGKTAIIRALRWIITNKPSGDEFRSNWGGETIVTLTLHNGTKVTRKKGNSTNEYLLQIEGENELSFKAFGTEVPVEIVNALAFDDINIQHQLDSPYLLSETPGQVAKHFNKIAKLEKIDLSIAYIQSRINNVNSQIKTNESNITSYKESLESYSYIPEFEQQLNILEKKVKSKDEINEGKQTISQLIEKLKNIEVTKSNYNSILQDSEVIDELLDLITKYKELKKELKEIKSCISDINDNQEEQKDYNALLAISDNVDKLLKLHKEYTGMQQDLISLRILIQDIDKTKQAKVSTLESLKIKEESYEQDFPEICPLCNTKIK